MNRSRTQAGKPVSPPAGAVFQSLPVRPWIGGAWMCSAMFLAACIDVSVKWVSTDYSTGQIVFLRSVTALPLLVTLCVVEGGWRNLGTNHWGWELYRGGLATALNCFFFAALAMIPLLDAVLLAYFGAVLAVLLAWPLLGERIGRSRWIAVGIAVGGVLVILRPVSIALEAGTLAALAAALCWALLSLSNRQLAGRESPVVLAFHTLPVSLILVGSWVLWADPAFGGGWTTPPPLDWAPFLIMGVCGGLAHLFVAHAWRHAGAGVVAPLEYTNLIWAAAAAWIFWREVPDFYTLVGGGAIIVGGYLALTAKDH